MQKYLYICNYYLMLKKNMNFITTIVSLFVLLTLLFRAITFQLALENLKQKWNFFKSKSKEDLIAEQIKGMYLDLHHQRLTPKEFAQAKYKIDMLRRKFEKITKNTINVYKSSKAND